MTLRVGEPRGTAPQSCWDAGRSLADRGTGTELERLSLCDTLDRVLNKGAVIAGDLTISVANIDLLYLSLQLVLTSVETARRELGHA